MRESSITAATFTWGFYLSKNCHTVEHFMDEILALIIGEMIEKVILSYFKNYCLIK